MSKANGGEFDKMPEFIESIFNVFKMINKNNSKNLKIILFNLKILII